MGFFSAFKAFGTMAKPVQLDLNIEQWKWFLKVVRDARPRYRELAKWMGHDEKTVITNLHNAESQIVRAWQRLPYNGSILFSVLSLFHLGLLFQAERRFVYEPVSEATGLSETERTQYKAAVSYCKFFEA